METGTDLPISELEGEPEAKLNLLPPLGRKLIHHHLRNHRMPYVVSWKQKLRELSGLRSHQAVISQSAATDYYKCPRKFAWRHRFDLHRKRQRPSKPLTIGSLFHELMAAYYTGESQDEAAIRLGRKIGDWIQEIWNSVELNGQTPWGEDPGSVQAELEQDLLTARVLANVFLRKYQLDRDRYEVRRVESRLTVRQKAIPVRMEGTVDLLLRDRREGGLWIVDHKTTSDPPMVRIQTAGFELQPRIYRLLVQGLYPEEEVRGFVHNVIRKPDLKFCGLDRDFTEREYEITRGPRKGEKELRREYEEVPKFGNYLRRCSEWFEKQSEEGTDPPLLQSWLAFPPGGQDTELLVMLMELGRACRATPTLEGFPRTGACTHSCTARGGTCEYLPLCSGHPDSWPALIEETYEQQTKGPERTGGRVEEGESGGGPTGSECSEPPTP